MRFVFALVAIALIAPPAAAQPRRSHNGIFPTTITPCAKAAAAWEDAAIKAAARARELAHCLVESTKQFPPPNRWGCDGEFLRVSDAEDLYQGALRDAHYRCAQQP